MLNKIRELAERKPEIAVTIAVTIFLGLTIRLISPGIHAAQEARNSLFVAKAKYAAEEGSANNISGQKAAYEQAFQQFQFYAQNLSSNVDTGEAIQDISQYAKNNNIQVVSIKPGSIVAGAYQNHLEGLPITMELSGSFPDILATMRQMENDGNPGEFRSVKIANDKTGDNVVADLTLVLYSTNQPMVTNYVTAPSGSADPFQPLKQVSQNNSKLPLVNQLLGKGRSKSRRR